MTLIAFLILLMLFCFSEDFRRAEKSLGCIFIMFFILDFLAITCITILVSKGVIP